jgi:predicted Zn-ribbon and HTH transcriptional regulator
MTETCNCCGMETDQGRVVILCPDCVADLAEGVRRRHRCLRCGHEWRSRLARPTTCPQCRNPYWDRPKTRNGRPRTREIYPK